MAEPLTIPAAPAAPSAEGERDSAAPGGGDGSRQSLVEARDALLRLLEEVPPNLPAIQSFIRTRVADAPIDILPLEAAGEVTFLSRPPRDPVVLVVAPRPGRVCLAVDPALSADLLGLALLHGLGHLLLGHVRPGDKHGHRDTAATLCGEGAARRWDRQVREAFAPWFDAASAGKRPDLLPEIPDPHEVQREALEALQATRADGNTVGLVVLATGLGKTWLSAFDSDRPPFGRLLFVAHREEILHQARETYRLIRPRASLGFYNGTEKVPNADVLFASIQTLSRVQHLRNFAADAFDYIVIDEFHHAVAGTYRRLLDHFTPRFLLGLTATPERMDGGDLLALCQENLVYRCDLADGIRRGLLSPFRYFGVPDEVDYRNIPWRSSRFDEQALTDAVATNSRAENVLDQYRKRAGKRALAFCCSLRHADFMADYFRRQGLGAAAVHSGDASAPRAASLEQLEAGKLDVVCAVDMFNEGVDLPHVDTVMMLRPTESPVIWLQQFGRGLRKAEGKDRLTVIDYIGNHRSFLQKVRALFNDVASDADIAGILTMASANQLTGLPPGCEVTYDLRAIDILKGLLRVGGGNQLIEAYYRDFRERHGVRPRAVEALHDGYNPRSVYKAHQSWLRFVNGMGDGTAGEQQLPQQAVSFLEVLETTPMTKSFKMLLLQAMLNHDALPGAIAIDTLVQEFARLAGRLAALRAEVGEDLDHADRLRASLERNPINAWVEGQGTGGTAYFAYQDGSFRSTFSVPADARDAFQELARERIDWRLAEYLQRGSAARQAGGLRFTGKVKRAGSRPMISLPKRETTPEIPEGLTRLIANDEPYVADFVKVALIVIKRPEQGENELPGVLSGWFGDEAGAPGTSHLVAFEFKDDTWHMRPAGLAGKPSPIVPWGHYLRPDIPPLFGLTFSKAIWDVGYVRRGDHVFLLVTLEKKGHVDQYQYEDRFLAADLFQWQSQNRTRRDSPDGRALEKHKELGGQVHLFIRRRKKIANRPAPFVYCGPVEFVGWERDAPITVRWRLPELVPESLREALCVPP
jgi:superfamily II DNA or RNA helicase